MFKFKPTNYRKLSDEKLAATIMNGNSAAFNELYDRYNARILYYFYRMLGNDKELAQDFLQELFFKVIDKPQQFDVERKFSTWIFSIAHNMCKNEYRSRQVRNIMEKGVDADSFPDIEETADYSSLQTEDIFGCLNEFDEIHRTAFLLKYREGLSIHEISAVLGLPVGTIKSRLFYTRKKIQEKLLPKIQNSNEYR